MEQALQTSDFELQAELYGLPTQMREQIQLLESLFRSVELAPSVTAELKACSWKLAGRAGCSVPSLTRKFYAWRNSGRDWRALLNHAKCKSQDEKLPAVFVQYWKGLCEANQRACKPAFRELCRQWMSGCEIPGFGVRRPDQTDLPRGLSYANLMRHAPTKFELSARRQGRCAAAAYRPLVFSTRAGLQCGQYYMFDDLWHDHKVNFLGVNKAAMRPLELCALDLFSAAKVTWGMIPMLLNDDDGARETIRSRHMRFLLADILGRIGYRGDGTTLMVEKGTAAISGELEKLLLDATDGAVKVDRNGIEGAAAFAGVYDGRGHGNSRFKAALESHHNLVHNEFALLAGQMGRNRDACPEELAGRDGHNSALIKACAALPPDRAALLRLPFIPYEQFLEIARFVYERINERTDHKLEGWEEAHLTVNEFRLLNDSPWSPMARLLQLPAHERAAVDVVLSKPGYVRCRRMSPAEVWQGGRQGLCKLRPQFLLALLGEELGVERPVQDDHLIEFQDRTLGPGIFRYLAEVTTPEGRKELLRPGETYLTHVNPFNPVAMLISRLTGQGAQLLGVAKRWETVDKADTEALHRQMGAAAHIEKELLKPIAQRGAELTRQRIADAKHNALVLAGAPLTQKEISTADRVRAEKGTLDDLIQERPDDAAEEAARSEQKADDMDKIFGAGE